MGVVVFVVCVCFCLLGGFVLVCFVLRIVSLPPPSHTSCGVFSCLSGRALDLRVDLRLLAPSFFTSLKLGLPVSQRSAAACEEKKPWGACLPTCILHLCFLSLQPRTTPNKHCATAKLLHQCVALRVVTEHGTCS